MVFVRLLHGTILPDNNYVVILIRCGINDKIPMISLYMHIPGGKCKTRGIFFLICVNKFGL